MKIGGRIRAAREAEGLSQEALARELGVSMMTVSRWERDVSPPSIRRLHEIAERLNVTASSLVEEEAVA